MSTPALPAPATTPQDPNALPPERGTPPGAPAQIKPKAWSRLKKSLLPILLIALSLVAFAALVYWGPGIWNKFKAKMFPATIPGADVPVLVVDAPTNMMARLQQLPITLGNITGTNINMNFGGSQFVMNGGTIIGSKDFTAETTNRYTERRGPAPAVDALPGITLPEREVIGLTQTQATLLPGEFATIVRSREKPGFRLELESPKGLLNWCRNHGELPTGTLVQIAPDAPGPVTFRIERF